MNANFFKVFIVLLVLFFSKAVLSHQQAQATPANCDVDLSQASSWLTQAQAKASSGDVGGAMGLLDQVTQALNEIKSSCAAGGTDATLSQKFTEPSGAFTVSYPAGWINMALPGNSGAQSQAQAILFASSQAAYDMLAKNTPDSRAQGVVVYVGTAKDIVKALRVDRSEKTFNQMTPTTLLQTISAGQSSNTAKFGPGEKLSPIGKYEAAEAAFTYTDTKTSTVIANGTLLIMQIASDQFAILLSFGAPNQASSVAPIARRMAATLQVPGAR